MPRTRYIYISINQSTLLKLPTARNKTTRVYCEVIGIIECSSICDISTTAYTYRATAIKGSKAALKT